MSTIHVDIVSAEREIFAGEAEMLFAPARLGEVGILPGHAPLLTQLKPGEVRVQLKGGEQQAFYISGGMLEVQPKIVTVISDTAVRAHDLDEAAVLKAKQEAEAKAAALKKRTITCVKGKLTKKVTAVKPKCPSGYKLKK